MKGLLLLGSLGLVAAQDDDAGGAIAGIVVLLFFLAIIFFILKSGLYIVRQAEAIAVTQMMKFHKIAPPGLTWITPIIQQPKAFNWRITELDETGRLTDKTTSDFRVDLRENAFNFPPQEVITQDGVTVVVNMLMFYRLVNIFFAVFEVEDVQQAIFNVAQTHIRGVFGGMTFAEALVSQQRVNRELMKHFLEDFAPFGIKVERMELLDLAVPPGSEMGKNMKMQAVAERERRAQFIVSEGRKAATRLTAEGDKKEQQNVGLADMQAKRKVSEGEREAKVTKMNAEKAAIEMVAEQVKLDGVKTTEYQISQKYLETFKAMSAAAARKTIYLPYDASMLTGLVGRLPKSFGMDGVKSNFKAPAAGAFDELD